MNNCQICNSKLNFYKKIGDISVYECLNCQICYTQNISTDQSLLNKKYYQENEYYKYLYKNQRNKFNFLIKKIFKNIKFRSLLEIGCGFGLFTNLLYKTNPNLEITVVEPFLNSKYIKDNKNIRVYKNTLDEFIKINKEKFDVVTFFDVLEHFKNPQEALQKIIPVLKNEKYLLVQVPNYQSFMQKICKNWSWWMVEDHKVHFSPKSIKDLLTKNNFKIIELITYESPWDFKKNLDGNFTNINNLFLRRIIKLFIYPIFFSFYYLFRNLIHKSNKGGLIFIIAKYTLK